MKKSLILIAGLLCAGSSVQAVSVTDLASIGAIYAGTFISVNSLTRDWDFIHSLPGLLSKRVVPSVNIYCSVKGGMKINYSVNEDVVVISMLALYPALSVGSKAVAYKLISAGINRLIY